MSAPRIVLAPQLTPHHTGITSRSGGDEPPAPSGTSAPSVDEVLATLNAQLQKLYDELPSRTALIVFSGHSDPRRMAELNARKSAFETAIRSGKNLEELDASSRWTSADGRDLEEEVEKAKRGLLFLGVKDAK